MKTTSTRTLMTSAILALGMLAVPAAPSEAAADTSVQKHKKKTYALIVAHNGSVDKGVAPLRYADDDGARYFELFDSMADQVLLLTSLDTESQRIFPRVVSKTRPPTKAELADAVKRLKTSIAKDKAAGVDTELFLVFTGHGNIDAQREGYLSLADGKLTRSDLFRDVVRPLEDAGYTHLIIDACHAYFMVRSRGGDDKPWRDDRSGRTYDNSFKAYLKGRRDVARQSSTLGVILSTSGTAEVHEWSRFNAGVFSHQLRSALLGGADSNGDGDITYTELDGFLFAANAAITDPKAKLNVHVRAPTQDKNRTLTRLGDYRDATILDLPEALAAKRRYYIEDERGLRYADFNASDSVRMVLLQRPLQDDTYYLRDDERQAPIELEPEQDLVHGDQLAFANVGEQARGAVDAAFRKGLFQTPFGPEFMAAYQALLPQIEASRAVTEERAPLRTQMTFNLDYALSAPPVADLEGVQNNVSASFGLELPWNFTAGLFAGYGFTRNATTRDDLSPNIHRISYGLEGAWSARLGESFSLGPVLRIGSQTNLFSNAEGLVCADPDAAFCGDLSSFRGEAALQTTFHTRSVGVFLRGGASLDTVRFESAAGEASEQPRLSPFVSLGVQF